MNIFQKLMASNLRRPEGLFGIYIGRRLKNNLSVYTEFENHVNLHEHENVLEIGYGPGYGLNYYLAKYGLNADGVDYSGVMRRMASRVNRKFLKNGSLRLFSEDFGSWTAEKKYDLVYLFNVIYFWKNPAEQISKLAGITEKNGRVAVYMDSPDDLNSGEVSRSDLFHKHEVDEVAGMLRSSGFRIEKISPHSLFPESFFLLAVRI